MALLEVKTEWAVYKDCFLQVARYQADNSRAIEIWNNEDGPIARITKRTCRGRDSDRHE